ncbi:MAG: hypothetical protein VB934_22255 [Polyangiaceae bacterium]
MNSAYSRYAFQCLIWSFVVLGGVSSGCDALVGGQCRDGLVAQEGLCVVDATGGTAGAGAGGKAVGGKGGYGGQGAGGAATNGGGAMMGVGGSNCQPPMTACPDGCVDLLTDIGNCGECDNYCLSEICVAGTCVGQTVGHVVAIGMNYAQVSQPMRTLLGNAVFLVPQNPVRIIEWYEHADGAAVANIDVVLAEQAALRGRTMKRSSYNQSELADKLLSTPQHVLLIYDQSSAGVGALQTWGAGMKDAIHQFSAAGGAVVVLASTAGTAEMGKWLLSSELLTVNSLSAITGDQVANDAPGHAVGLSVLAPFLAKPVTVSFDVTVDPQQPFATVLSRKSNGAPVVVHRVMYADP